MKALEVVEKESQRQGKGTSFLATLTLGHVVVHWYHQLWPMIIPSLKTDLGLTNIQLGALSSLRQFTTGPLTLPSGVLADFFRKRTALIFAAAFIFLGVSHFLLAQAPTYIWIIPIITLVGVGSALWHPAALGSISLRFPERRASALSIHGIGASVGDTIAPIAMGSLLLIVSWRRLLELHLIPALVIAFVLWRFITSIHNFQEGSRPSMNTYLNDLKSLIRHRVVLAIIGVSALTGMGRLSVMTFLPIYIQEDLGYSAFALGFFWALLHVMGTVSMPVLAYLSDKVGRIAVLVPSLVVFGLLYLALAAASPGIQLILAIGALGLFFYAISAVTLAAVMDVASDKVQSSSTGIFVFSGQFTSLPSPILAGFLVNRYGTESVFLYAGSLTLVAALLLAVINMPNFVQRSSH